MLDNNTAEKLREMKLGVMAAAFKKQLADQKMAQLSFEERFGLIVDAEWAARKSNRLLILDEWLLYDLREGDVREILEIVERRHKRASTIFCSQFDVGGWHEKLGEPTIADAICDRIVHDSYTLLVKGNESMRKHNGIQDEA